MEKRILAIVMAVFLIAALAVAVSAAQAVPSAHEVRVDGETVDVRAFNIGGRNYFMLRDVAYILRDTGARFDIEWDANRRAILLETGDRYGGTPAEIDTSATTAATSRAEVYVNGVLMNFAAYNIRGHNFFQLRELGDALGFGVDFDAATNAVLILTDVGYSPAGLNPPEPPAPTPEPTPAPTPEAEESVEPDVEPDVEPEPEATPAPTPAPAAATGGGSAEFVRSIGPGWNLGNQFDAFYYGGLGFPWLGGGTYEGATVTLLETAWVGGAGSVVTREFMQALNNAGFTAIRIPVTWNKVAPGPDYQIREDWMRRVREVVQWAYDLDMHIVLNTHHENSIHTHDDIHAIGLANDEIEHSIYILSSWWTQIAREFANYGDRLMFAGLNEPRGSQREWMGGVPETRANLNRLNQAFVDAVRATGGNNATRFLVVPTHAASSTEDAFNGFTMPNDSANDRLLLAIHTYSPFAWAHDGRGTYGGPASIRTDLERVARHAERLGVSVMLTEWGSINNGEDDNLAQRAQHAYDYVSIARELGMPTFWWDNNAFDSGGHGFGLINRATREIVFPTIIDAIIRAHQ